jgi:hypothetical protein
MRKLSKEQMTQAVACIACVVVFWVRGDDFGASEFSGGWLTGALLRMADLGALFFLVALVLTFFLRRAAAIIAFVAALFCLPFYLYILMPGPYRSLFKGEYSVPLDRAFHWDSWSAGGVLSLCFIAVLSLRNYFKIETDT